MTSNTNDQGVDDDARTIINAATGVFGQKAVEAYRFNPASVRVRVLSDRFKGLDRVQREELTNTARESLPDRLQRDIILLLLSPRRNMRTASSDST